MQNLLTGFVQLPDEQKAAIAGIFVAVFALIFDYLIGKYPFLAFLRQYQEAWALALATTFTAWLENLLPADFGDIAIKLISLLIALVVYLLGRTMLVRRGVTAFLRVPAGTPSVK
jgi:hypothetical protein